MDELTCRLLPFQVADGPTNMATDEVLLESAVSGVTTLRFYGWNPPTLSLGYFQRARVRLADPLLAQLPLVRRPSGGDTLVHDREVTYALALPPGPVWQHSMPWSVSMHQIIAAALRPHGVDAELWAPVQPRSSGGPLCFHHFTAGDVIVGGAKVAGSAQRKRRGALMQHGGILYGTSAFTPALAGIDRLTGILLTESQICQGVQHEFQRKTGCRLMEGELTSAEIEAVAALVREKYATASWNRKR